jgi:predicted enzyme related to lactoylglutathione lyase
MRIYTIKWTEPDKTIGGMLKTPEDKANIPPHWMSYISVADLDATLDKVKKLGGTVIVPKTTAGDMGSFAIIQDPTGAHIAIWKPSQKAM